MRAFDFVMTLYSFVYALGVAHILAAVGDIIRAGKRVRFSWLNAAWMLNALLLIVSWWLALWDLRNERTWTMPTVLFFFLMSCLIYVLARLVSPPIPQEGPVDLQVYHREEGWKYGSVFSAIVVLTIGMVYAYGSVTQNWVSENKSNWPTLAAAVAATLSSNRWIQIAAVLVVYAIWIWYFAALQGPLS
jgi:hypothetical protein